MEANETTIVDGIPDTAPAPPGSVCILERGRYVGHNVRIDGYTVDDGQRGRWIMHGCVYDGTAWVPAIGMLHVSDRRREIVRFGP